MTEKMVEFLKLVEAFPCLYNHSLNEYSRKDLTEKAWAEISLKINWTVPECKEKWRNVRNGFVKSLKAPPSGSAAKSRKQYYLHDEMQFVIPFVKPTNNEKEPGNIPTYPSSQPSSANDVETQPISTNDELFDPSHTIQPSRKKFKHTNNAINNTFMHYITAKRQNMEKLMQKSDTENPRKMFLLSLLPDIENLDNNNMRLLKIEIMSLIQKYQILQQNQPFPATATYVQDQAQSNSQSYQQPSQEPGPSTMAPNQLQPFHPYSPISSAMSLNQQSQFQPLYSPVSSASSNQQQSLQKPNSPASTDISPNQQNYQLLRSPLDYSTSRDECPTVNLLKELTQYDWNDHN